ncbi:MAG: hypothetical protein J7M06_02600, partial [Proteobacteria bacterium]|nr:hypothetical protein [Pseudomonadota bacterium]
MFQEEAQIERLKELMPNWEAEINTLIDSLVAEEEKRSVIEKIILAGNDGDIVKNRKIVSCLETLKQIKTLQQKLNEKERALFRETIYLKLINHYLSCLKLSEEIRKDYSLSGVSPAKIKEKIEDDYQSGNFYKVVSSYRNLKRGETESGGDLKNHAYYVLSLIQLGLTEEAGRAAENLLKEGFVITSDNAYLMFKLGEWLIDMEHYEVAERFFQRIIQFYRTEEEWHEKAEAKAALFQSDIQYLKVRNKLDQAIDLFERGKNFSRGCLLCLDAQKYCPDPACQDEVKSTLDKFVAITVADMEEDLLQIDQKIEESKILEARTLISQIKKSFPGEEYPLPIIERLALVQEKEKILQEEELKWKDELDRQKLEKADKLLEGEHYEEVIEIFDQFQGTPYQDEAEIKKQLAIDGLARDKRIRAGQLFFEAKHSEDPEIKKTYFIESYNILEDVIRCYPNNKYAEKIKKNLEDVRSEIEKIYPQFFLE